jgi:hypothetical protein
MMKITKQSQQLVHALKILQKSMVKHFHEQITFMAKSHYSHSHILLSFIKVVAAFTFIHVVFKLQLP